MNESNGINATVAAISSTWYSALGALLLGGIFFYKKHLDSNSANRLHELLNKKEANLNEAKCLLLEEQTKQQKASNKIQCRANNLEENERKLEYDTHLLEEKIARHKKIEDNLRSRINDIEKRERKLTEDTKSFEERLKEQDRIRIDVEGRLNDVQIKEKKLKVDLDSLEKERAGALVEEERLSIRLMKEIDELKTKVKESNALVEEEQKKRKESEEESITNRASNSRDDEVEESSKIAVSISASSSSSTSTSTTTTTSATKINTSMTDTVIDEEDNTDNSKKESSSFNHDESSESENEKRFKMIDKELKDLIKQADENELEEPFDEDSIKALTKGALKICYTKKFYDVMNDTMIYFPSVPQTVVDYRLIEEAERFYFDDVDEFPQDLSIGLRSVATEFILSSQDDDYDEEYMTAIAQDIAV